MGSFLKNSVRPFDLQNWIKTNAVGSLKGKPMESYKAYLAANGGTGSTIHDLENSFLKAAGATGQTLHDKWSDYLGRIVGQSGGKATEKVKNRFK